MNQNNIRNFCIIAHIDQPPSHKASAYAEASADRSAAETQNFIV